LLHANPYNNNLPGNLWIIAGDPSLEIQAQVISQIGGQTLPQDAWKNVHQWIADLVGASTKKLGSRTTTVFIDCNPSFSAYTELAMMAAEQLIVPCSSDGSSARAIDNIGQLLYGVGSSKYGEVSFSAKAQRFKLALPLIHSVLLNRSTLYSERASKAFGAMFGEIERRTETLKSRSPGSFVGGEVNFHVIPDNHSVAIICSHLGLPLYQVRPGQYDVHDTRPQVNPEPLDRYRTAVSTFLEELITS
jgi:chromosome partitioning protein